MLLPSRGGLLSTTAALVGGDLSLKIDNTALGGSVLKVLLPSVHFCKKRSLRTLPTIRFGRSEKKTVTGETSCKVRTPSLYATFFAVCTNRNSGALVCAIAKFVAAKHSDTASNGADFLMPCIAASYFYHAPLRSFPALRASSRTRDDTGALCWAKAAQLYGWRSAPIRGSILVPATSEENCT